MSDYTPTLDEAREQFAKQYPDLPADLDDLLAFDRMIESVRAEERERTAVQRDALYAVLWDLDQKGLLPPCTDMSDGNGECMVCTAMESAANDGAHEGIAREGA